LISLVAASFASLLKFAALKLFDLVQALAIPGLHLKRPALWRAMATAPCL
jgi:hypothetical protein